VEHFSIGHLGFYKYVGRTEVAPTPTDWDVLKTGIALRAGAYPVLANASWPFKRMFETALIDEDLTNRFSTAVYARLYYDGDALHIDTGTIDRDFFTPARMILAGH